MTGSNVRQRWLGFVAPFRKVERALYERPGHPTQGDWLESVNTDCKWVMKIQPWPQEQFGGNPGDIAPVGEGVSELRIHSGPGYPVYVAFDGHNLVILLGGGSKRTQPRDIAAAKLAWAEYKRRKATSQ